MQFRTSYENINNLFLHLSTVMAASKDRPPIPVAAQGSGTSEISSDKFAYLPPPETFYSQQGLREKLITKTKENPFVPLGVIFTTVVLGVGIATLRSNDGRRAQILMRLRVGGQAFAIFAMLAGIYYKTKTDKINR